MQIFLLYLLIIGVTGVIFLRIDKYKATHERWRIQEKTLHIIEFLGGIFLMLPAMYIIRHKNKKTAYNWISWTALIIWIAGIWYVLSKVL